MGKLSHLKKALDMSKAARMKRAAGQGFDVNQTWYHGTSGNEGIVGFERSRMGSGTDEGFLGRGVYTSSGPDVASSYAVFGRGQGAVYPLTSRGNYLLLEERPEDVGDMFARSRRVKEELGLHAEADAQDITDAARAKGYDGIEFVFADSQETPGGVRERVTFDPENIRSVNAKFDPSATTSNILGRSTPGGMATAGVLSAGAEFVRRRANKTQTLKGLGETALTVGSGILGDFVGDLSRLGGYLNPFMSVEDTERGAEALSGSMQYIPSGAATPYLDRVSQGLEQAEKEASWAAGKLGWENSIPNKIYQALPERAQGIIDTTLL